MTLKLLVGLIWLAIKAYAWMEEREQAQKQQQLKNEREARLAKRQRAQTAAARRNAAPVVVERAHSPAPKTWTTTAPGSDVRRQIEERCKRLGKLISSRFSPTELTATRYRLLIDEVRLGVLSNLTRQQDLRTSIDHHDREKLELELADLDGSDKREIISERIEMLDHVDKRIAELEAANEQALHVLDRAIVTLAGAQPLRGASGARLESSVSDLESMLSKAHSQGAGSLEDDFEIKSSKKKDKKKSVITPGASG